MRKNIKTCNLTKILSFKMIEEELATIQRSQQHIHLPMPRIELKDSVIMSEQV
jgi:hypothetical protein